MASVVVKTIWQSKEIHEAGDTPTGVESCSQLVPEAPRGVTSRAKGIPKKKKAVSFHGVEPQMSHQPMHWCLNLKRSSACTNVSLLNLAAMEPTDSTGTDSTVEDLSGQLTLAGPPASPTLSWDPDDADITEILSGVNSGLVRAKDSITSLKEKTNRVNQHVQSLQSECSVLSENLERRRQEAEELEGYCIQLKENCWKVTRSVEDAEIKTNVLKQNSALLEEKLRYLQQQLQDETPRRQEAELQEPEEKQKPEAGLSWNGLGPAAMSQCCPGPPGSPDKPSRPHGLVPAGWGMGPRAGEGPYVSEQELQKLFTGIEELSQGSQLSTESLQQLLDRALTSLVDEVKQRGLTPACPSCQRLHKKILTSPASPATPTLLSPGAGAPGLSQTRQGRGPELHPSAGPRRGPAGQEPTADRQDEARVRKEAEGMGGGEKMATLDHLHLKMCSLHDHLSNLPLEGSTGTMGGGSSAGTPPKQGGSAPEQ
ncbi:testis-specific serine kinase substrate isoform X11 [Gorilla gorilla gorilla]|uniref:testis-specific serine kinase substrate isoform X11 n=1 Tax=Gorilla gorilla gorilla TaxID=9595 RepID=UPI002445ED7B|nr:testis-specific serine kinase substrate isoform X11 [Gorilla gorilla gorilla]